MVDSLLEKQAATIRGVKPWRSGGSGERRGKKQLIEVRDRGRDSTKKRIA